MREMMRSVVAAGAVMGVVGMAEAHLGTMSIKGGESFKPAEVVQVKFDVSTQHSPNKFDFLLSTDGGATFKPIETKQFPGTGQKTYEWTVPNSPSTTAQFKICQWADANTCEYQRASTNFTISAGTAIRLAGSGTDDVLGFDETTRNLAVSFRLDREERVQVIAFDAQGKLVGTLRDGRYAAGSHQLSLFSNRLAAAGTVVFQLRVGKEVRIQGVGNLH